MSKSTTAESANLSIVELTIDLDSQPPEVQALGILALAGQHLAHMLVLQGRIAQLMNHGHVLPAYSSEMHSLLVESALQLSQLADFNSLDGCTVLEKAHAARHPMEVGVAELQAHKQAGLALN